MSGDEERKGYEEAKTAWNRGPLPVMLAEYLEQEASSSEWNTKYARRLVDRGRNRARAEFFRAAAEFVKRKGA